MNSLACDMAQPSAVEAQGVHSTTIWRNAVNELVA